MDRLTKIETRNNGRNIRHFDSAVQETHTQNLRSLAGNIVISKDANMISDIQEKTNFEVQSTQLQHAPPIEAAFTSSICDDFLYPPSLLREENNNGNISNFLKFHKQHLHSLGTYYKAVYLKQDGGLNLDDFLSKSLSARDSAKNAHQFGAKTANQSAAIKSRQTDRLLEGPSIKQSNELNTNLAVTEESNSSVRFPPVPLMCNDF